MPLMLQGPPGSFPGHVGALQRVAERPSAALPQETAAAAVAGEQLFPTPSEIGSLARLWTLYKDGDKGRGLVAWAVQERSG